MKYDRSYAKRQRATPYSTILEGMIEGKRRRGRPKMCYKSQIIKVLIHKNISRIKLWIENHGEKMYCRPINEFNTKKNV